MQCPRRTSTKPQGQTHWSPGLSQVLHAPHVRFVVLTRHRRLEFIFKDTHGQTCHRAAMSQVSHYGASYTLQLSCAWKKAVSIIHRGQVWTKPDHGPALQQPNKIACSQAQRVETTSGRGRHHQGFKNSHSASFLHMQRPMVLPQNSKTQCPWFECKENPRFLLQ